MAVSTITKALTIRRKTATLSTNFAGVGYLPETTNVNVIGVYTDTYGCLPGYYNGSWFVVVADISNGVLVPVANASVPCTYFVAD